MKKTSSDRRKINPRGGEFGYGDVEEIGGGKKPLSRGKEMPLSEGRRGLHDVGWEGLPRGGVGRLADGGKKGPMVGRRCDPP